MGRAGAAVVVALGLVALVPVAALSDQGSTVVVTRPGVVFHKAGGSDVRGRGFDRTADEAIEAGYIPCPNCFGKQVGTVSNAGRGFGSGAASAAFAVDAITSPPVGMVVQPFGVRTFGHGRSSGVKGIRDPYQQPDTIKSTGFEQGAFETQR
jgi:hypothetical protein